MSILINIIEDIQENRLVFKENNKNIIIGVQIKDKITMNLMFEDNKMEDNITIIARINMKIHIITKGIIDQMTKEEEFIKINNIMTFIKKQDNTMFKIKAKEIQGNNNSNNIIIMKLQLDNNNNNNSNNNKNLEMRNIIQIISNKTLINNIKIIEVIMKIIISLIIIMRDHNNNMKINKIINSIQIVKIIDSNIKTNKVIMNREKASLNNSNKLRMIIRIKENKITNKSHNINIIIGIGKNIIIIIIIKSNFSMNKIDIIKAVTKIFYILFTYFFL
jgi:hypothetical protein